MENSSKEFWEQYDLERRVRAWAEETGLENRPVEQLIALREVIRNPKFREAIKREIGVRGGGNDD